MAKSTADKIAKTLEKGKISPVYLLTGEDLFRKKELIGKITAAVHPDDFNIFSSSADQADMGEVLALANTAPVFSERRLVILTGIEKLRKNSKEALLHYLENPLETTVLILTHNDNKKFKTEKSLAALAAEHGEMANLDELKRQELSLWVSARFQTQGMNAGYEAVETLCEIVGGDLNALSQEIEKLALYTAGRSKKDISKEDILVCVGFSKEENPFELSNAVQNMNKKKALAMADKLLNSGEEPVAVLGKISYPVLKMARVKYLLTAGVPSADILHTAGLSFWETSFLNNARHYPSKEIFLKTLDRIIEADKALKTSTASDPKTLIKGVLMTLLAGNK